MNKEIKSMRKLKMIVPKGRIYDSVAKLLKDAGFGIKLVETQRIASLRNEIETKIMKPQNIPQLVALGYHDIGFTGRDWIVETQADVVEVMDLKLDPVRIIAAVPGELLQTDLHSKKLVVASEYENIARKFLEKEKYNYTLIRAYGATESFPPDDADMIIDNVSTGRTLKEHNLHIINSIMESSTRFITNKKALRDNWKGEKIREIGMLFQAVLDARERVMLEMNIPKEKFDKIVKQLPCMRSPTVAPLYGEQGYAIKVAVKRVEVTKLIPLLKKLGATDILEYELRKVII